MKPHPRIRKTIKWGGAAVTVLLVVVWVGSGWFFVYWAVSPTLLLSCDSGMLGIAGVAAPTPSAFASDAGLNPYFHFATWTPLYSTAVAGWRCVVPIWIPLLGLAMCTLAASRLDTLARRRAKLNLCRKCGYDRTGLLKDAKCPECGAAPAKVV